MHRLTRPFLDQFYGCATLYECVLLCLHCVCRVSASEAVGQASAELLCPYPPGVPLVFPGELVTQEALNALRGAKEGGGYVTGASDPSLNTMLILAS
jgi:arginine/lysine/ornithine decarboxylase